MSGADQLAAFVYQGVWGVLARWFRVPRDPPTLPAAGNEVVVSSRPAEGYLKYLKFYFWIGLWPPDVAITVGWIALMVLMPPLGLALAPIAFVLAVLPDIVAYVVLHLRYDTTWYVMTDRSLRIRTGVWSITETTISFENVQNVKISQGPVQRYFGISDLVVETAGGGASGGEQPITNTHEGRLVGIADAHLVRDQILKRVRASRGAGLGDEHHHGAGWSPAHVAALREIKAEISQLRSERSPA